MLGDISKVENIYIACGYTDLRLGIDGLAQLVQRQFRLDPFSNSPVCILRTAAGSDQGTAVGGGRLRAAVQAGGRRCVSVAAEPAGDAKVELERIWLAVGRAEIRAAHGAAQG